MKCLNCGATALYTVDGRNGYCSAHKAEAVAAQLSYYDRYRATRERERNDHLGALNMARGGASIKAADYNAVHGSRTA